MKNKKGFTLIELLAVIIILAIVALIATPIVLNVVEDARKSAGQSEANMILKGITDYCETERMGFGNTNYCQDGITEEEIKHMVNPGKVDLSKLQINYYDGELLWLYVESNGYKYGLSDGKMEIGLDKKPPTQPNKPDLLGKLTPIYYSDGQWKKADVNTKWYDYDNKEWANAVVLNRNIKGDIVPEDAVDLWYVWIPRFKYQLFDAANKNSEIKIEFEYKTSTTGNIKCVDLPKEELAKPGGPSENCYKRDDENIKPAIGDWYTHPAFTLGGKEIEGIWVGKFETSGTTNDMKIKPNVPSLRSVNVSTFSKSFQNMSTKLNGDSHMMKNMEWGAVTYLAQSKYGLCTDEICSNITINNNKGFITGIAGDTENAGQSDALVNTWDTVKGQKASTTQNIYGIYDMSGGAWEYVMGSSASSTGEFLNKNAGFNENPNSKHHDLYSYDTQNTSTDSGKLGDATKETKNWQGDYARFPCESYPWFLRGGHFNGGAGAGVFGFVNDDGGAFGNYSARGVLSPR